MSRSFVDHLEITLMRVGHSLICLILFALGYDLLASKSQAEEYYYALVFGSQSHPKQLRYSHTWSTAVKVTGVGSDLNSYAIEINTISWLPKSLDVHVWDLRPEPGINLDLYQTISTVMARNENITVWGPFRIKKEAYESSLRLTARLNSGQIQYRAISGRNLEISDCIHAVAAIDPVFGRGHYPLIRIGKPASRYIARQVVTRSVFDQSLSDNSWLIPRLGLDRYPIEVVSPVRIPHRACALCLIPE